MSDRGPSTSALCSWSAAVAGAWIKNSSDTDALHCASTIVQRCITLGKTLVYSIGLNSWWNPIKTSEIRHKDFRLFVCHAQGTPLKSDYYFFFFGQKNKKK